MTSIAVFGLGKVGLPMAYHLGCLGHEVWGYDVNKELMRKLRRKENPLFEHIEWNFNLADSSVEAVEKTEWAFVIAPTPLSGKTLSSAFITNIINEIDSIVSDKYKVNVVSTLDPRDAREVCNGHNKLRIIYNPPLIRLGQVAYDFAHAHIMFLGCDDVDSKELQDELASIWNNKCANEVRGNVISIACAKLAINATLSARGAWGNDINAKLSKLGADADVVFRALGFEPRIGGTSYMLPGPPPGGPCLPRDSLIWNDIHQSPTSDAVMNSHAQTLNKYAKIATEWVKLHEVTNRKIAVVGLGYKPNALDITDAVGMTIANAIEKLNPIVYDPTVKNIVLEIKPSWIHAPNIDYVVNNADFVILCVDYPDIRNRLAESSKIKVLDLSLRIPSTL